MAIGIDDLDYEDDDIVVNEPSTILDPPVDTPSLEGIPLEEDFLDEYLKSKGIQDKNLILFEEDNEIVPKKWEELSKEEKFNILNSGEEVNYINQLSDEEAEFLNTLRNQGLTPSTYLLTLNNQTPQAPTYKIDDLSDDEVYLLDLESRVGELTDEQLENALNLAKLNEDLYKLQIEGIRKEYKEREDYQTQQEEAALELERQEQFAQYLKTISSAIDNLTSIGNLDLNLEDADKEDLAEFILSNDQSGENYLQSALQDPETLVKAAWFIINGDEAFNNIEEYFTNLIKKVSKARYEQGYKDALNGTLSKTVVISKPTISHSYNSIDDLD